ncbi:hypothetical protein AB0383_18485 [Amycolatopsis sp. NPDC051373]|uniref:hypothetical protein n=1 Tax=Amycolatopsis sp. NPDC051373 TaxID=3155801 RepID=UPI003450E82E
MIVTEAGHRTADAITAATGNAAVDVKHLELADRDSVAKLASDWQGPLHILVNNAGVMAEPLNRTPEGGSTSSPSITSATSASRSACTTPSPEPATRASCP